MDRNDSQALGRRGARHGRQRRLPLWTAMVLGCGSTPTPSPTATSAKDEVQEQTAEPDVPSVEDTVRKAARVSLNMTEAHAESLSVWVAPNTQRLAFVSDPKTSLCILLTRDADTWTVRGAGTPPPPSVLEQVKAHAEATGTFGDVVDVRELKVALYAACVR